MKLNRMETDDVLSIRKSCYRFSKSTRIFSLRSLVLIHSCVHLSEWLGSLSLWKMKLRPFWAVPDAEKASPQQHVTPTTLHSEDGFLRVMSREFICKLERFFFFTWLPWTSDLTSSLGPKRQSSPDGSFFYHPILVSHLIIEFFSGGLRSSNTSLWICLLWKAKCSGCCLHVELTTATTISTIYIILFWEFLFLAVWTVVQPELWAAQLKQTTPVLKTDQINLPAPFSVLSSHK